MPLKIETEGAKQQDATTEHRRARQTTSKEEESVDDSHREGVVGGGGVRGGVYKVPCRRKSALLGNGSVWRGFLLGRDG